MKLPPNLGTQGKVLSIDTVDGNTGILTWTSPGGGILADDIGIGTSDISITNTSGTVLIDSQSSTTTIDGHTGVVIQANTGHLEIKEGLNNSKYLKLHADTDNCIISGEVKQQGVANQNARNLVFEAGQGTGIGTGGDIVFKVAKSGASGSDNNPFITALTIKQDAVIEFNNNLSVNDGILTVNSEVDSNNQVTDVLILKSQTTGTPVNNIGVGMNFQIETVLIIFKICRF